MLLSRRALSRGAAGSIVSLYVCRFGSVTLLESDLCRYNSLESRSLVDVELDMTRRDRRCRMVIEGTDSDSGSEEDDCMSWSKKAP